jgi:hypothetical protein
MDRIICELVINAKPDRNGVLWLTTKDTRAERSDDQYYCAKYLRTQLRCAVKTEYNELFVGLIHEPTRDGRSESEFFSAAIRHVSEWLTGDATQARFCYAEQGMCNGEDVMTVFTFRIWGPPRATSQDDQ